MDAVVLAGGYATRLWPITRDRPKMFLPLGDRPVVDRLFGELEADDRVETVYVSTNQRFADEFRAYFEDGPFEKPALSVEETTAEDEKLGVVGALAQLVEREGVADDLLVVGGDNLFGFELGAFLDDFEARGAPLLAAYDVGSRERATSYGLVDVDGDSRVVDFQEKPDDPQSTLVSVACYALPADALELLGTYLDAGENPDEPGWFVQWLHERRPVYAHVFDGAWFDIGTRASYLDAVTWALDGDRQVADGARVENSTIGPNTQVMEGATVVDSRVESSVVFPDATIRGSEITESIVDESAHVEDVELHTALVGPYTRLRDGAAEDR